MVFAVFSMFNYKDQNVYDAFMFCLERNCVTKICMILLETTPENPIINDICIRLISNKSKKYKQNVLLNFIYARYGLFN